MADAGSATEISAIRSDALSGPVGQRGAAESMDLNSNLKVSSKEDAKRLATQHLALRKYDWGKPGEISENPESFIVTFDTPEAERRLIGMRALVVNKKTGVVNPQVRR